MPSRWGVMFIPDARQRATRPSTLASISLALRFTMEKYSRGRSLCPQKTFWLGLARASDEDHDLERQRSAGAGGSDLRLGLGREARGALSSGDQGVAAPGPGQPARAARVR